MGRSLRNQIHLETKREQKKKEQVEKMLDALKTNKNGNRTGMTTTSSKEKRKRKSIQSRLNKDVRTIENSQTSLGEMHNNNSNYDSD
jgi:hypothetical protein